MLTNEVGEDLNASVNNRKIPVDFVCAITLMYIFVCDITMLLKEDIKCCSNIKTDNS